MVRRRVSVLLLAPVLAVLALFATAGVASAQPPTTNGCSTPGASGNSVPGVFDFTTPCDHHDYCYEGYDPSGNVAVVSRLSCDNRFLGEMLASCTALHGTSGTKNAKRCRDTAYRYYTAVRIFGGRYYDPGYSTRA